MNVRIIALSLISCCIGWSTLLGQSSPADAKAKLAKWVETRQLISKETANWDVDQEYLIATRDLLAAQAEELEASVETLKSEETASDEDRRLLTQEKSDLQLANVALAKQIAQMETDIKKLIKIFPEPLKDKLDALIVQIPDDPESTDLTLGKRLTHVLGILGQAEKFNSTANFVGEIREVGGQKIQVDTVYWGLAFAIYVDTNGTTAGFGMPGDDGWVWTENKAIAADAKRFVDMYEGNTDVIDFVELPISIQ